jgi:FAD/FMN-containing dehydrogenase
VTDGMIAHNEQQRRTLWMIRENPADALIQAGTVLRHDVSVPISKVPDLISEGETFLREKIPGVRFLPFGHIGDGNIHYNLLQPETMDPAEFLTMKAEVQTMVFDLVQSLGGSISAEHGIGRLKRDELLARKPDLDLELMRRVKAALDPDGILNPGAVL